MIMGVWTAAGKGLRYKEHPTRKHGKKPDRYWCLQYRLDGRNINEAVGWWSDGISQSQCEVLLNELRVNQKSGQGPRTLKEMREENRARREAEEAAKKAAADKSLTLAGFWEAEYYPKAALSHSARGLVTQRGFIKGWLAPLSDRPLKDITIADLEKLVLRPMVEAGKSPSRIRQALTLVSVIWNLAADRGLVSGENPITRIKKPKRDDQRDRFLTKDEASKLLAVLRESSPDSHDIALLSLFSGLRIGECLALTWVDVDFESGVIFVKDTKNKRNRHAYMTEEISAMLSGRYANQAKTGQVFALGPYSKAYQSVRTCFSQALADLKLNEGVTDSRQKVVIHTLRHTFASWHVQMGTPLYTVSKLMGHSSLKMTERYAHLAPDTQRAAAMDLEGILNR
jgi:integrase